MSMPRSRVTLPMASSSSPPSSSPPRKKPRGGRQPGARTWKNCETEAMLIVVEDILPIGDNDWEIVALEFYNATKNNGTGWTNRSGIALKSRFERLAFSPLPQQSNNSIATNSGITVTTTILEGGGIQGINLPVGGGGTTNTFVPPIDPKQRLIQRAKAIKKKISLLSQSITNEDMEEKEEDDDDDDDNDDDDDDDELEEDGTGPQNRRKKRKSTSTSAHLKKTKRLLHNHVHPKEKGIADAISTMSDNNFRAARTLRVAIDQLTNQLGEKSITAEKTATATTQLADKVETMNVRLTKLENSVHDVHTKLDTIMSLLQNNK